ncbi:MAG: Hpt domain-containing protein [Treponema sp.]|nr:Hpt domain-containing protein [Treponema sp.]
MADDVVYVDYDDGLKRVMNKTALYVKLLGQFKATAKMDELTALLSAGDMEKAQIQAHTIKGMAGNLSLIEMYKQILELETQIKARNVDPGQIEKVQQVYAATVQEVERIIAQNA